MATLPDLLAAAQQNLTAAAQAATAQQAQLDQARAQHLLDIGTIAALQAQVLTAKAPPPPAGFSVAFFDGFDGPLDPNLWTVVDRQGYARDQAWLSKDQVTVKDSVLTITAANLPTPINGRTVVSGAVLPGPNAVRLRTPTGTARWEICAALPLAPALWSAGRPGPSSPSTR